MVAYEHIMLRGTTGNSGGAGATNFVPTAAEAQGNFSALCPGGFNSSGVCVPGGGIQIYDPTSAVGNGNRTPFPDNMIPSTRFNPTGVAILKLYPAPNSSQSSTINYVSTDIAEPEGYYSLITPDRSLDQ
jgi:trimeric autotransporter adhesin